MTLIPIIYVVRIKDIFTSDLTTICGIDDKLNKELFNLPYKEIIADFSDVNSVSPDFVNHYLLNKSQSGKIVHEVNMPTSLQRIIDCHVY